MSQQSYRHHYIPIWYQKGFLAPGQTSFKILDMRPDLFRDAGGNVRGMGRAILNKGPDLEAGPLHHSVARPRGRRY